MQMRGSSAKVSEESERGRERERVDTVNCSDWRTRQEIRKSSKSAKEPKAAEVSHVLSEVKAKQHLRSTQESASALISASLAPSPYTFCAF